MHLFPTLKTIAKSLRSYLIVDWERRNFSLSQCQFSTSTKQKLVAIHSPNASSSQGGLSTGTKVGIAIAVVILVLLAALLMYLLLRRHQKKKRLAANPPQPGLNPAEDTIRRGHAKGELGTGLDNTRYEMEGSDGNALRPYGGATPPWVNEKARYPGLDNRAEADSADASPRVELNSPTTAIAPGGFFGGRGVHEMYDASSIPPIELPGDRTHRREMEGSTPSDSFFSSNPSSPLSRPQSGKPSPASRTGLFRAMWRRSKGSSTAGGPSAPSSPRRSNGSRGPASLTGAGARDEHSSSDMSGLMSPVSRRATFSPPLRPGRDSEREGGVLSPISPASTEDGYGDGIFRGFGRAR